MSPSRVNSPVFIVGAQRSGTTAIALAVSAAAYEVGGMLTVNGKLPYYLKRWWMDDASGRHPRADEVIHSLHRRRPYGPATDDWLLAASGALVRSAERIASGGERRSAWDEARQICVESYGGRDLWGDKYNEYLLDLPYLVRLFPEARWLFIARDPHAVVRSMMRWTGEKPWNPRSATACAAKWRTWNARWLAGRRRIRQARRLEVLYEDVCDGRATPAIAAFLGFDPSAELASVRRLHDPAPPTTKLPSAAIEMWRELRSACGKNQYYLGAGGHGERTNRI